MAQRTEKIQPTEQMSDDDHLTMLNNLRKAKSDAQASAGECSAVYKQYEKLGGNKKGLNIFNGLDTMGEEKGADVVRTVLKFCCLKGWDLGPDMVDMMEAKAGAQVGEAATKKATKKTTEASVASVKETAVARASDRAAKDLAKPESNVGKAAFRNTTLIVSDEEARRLERETGAVH